MANIQKIHDALLVLHKEFDILNKENERVWGIAQGMQDTLKNLMKKPDNESIVKPRGRKLSKAHKMKLSEAALNRTKRKSRKQTKNGNGKDSNKPLTIHTKTGTRTISPEGRQRILDGIQRRWAKYHAEKSKTASAS